MKNTTKGRFYNNTEQNNDYLDTIAQTSKFKNKQGNFLDKDVVLNINSKDNDMYFAYNFAILNQTMKEKRLGLVKNSYSNICLQDNLKMLYNELFPVTGYIDRMIDMNNKYYSNFNIPIEYGNNPWLVIRYKHKNNIMQDEFGSQLKNNTRIELLAKNMLWFNRATKQLGIVRKHIVESKAKKEAACDEYGKSFEEIVKNIYRDTNFYNGQSLVSEFTDKYSGYIYGDYEKEEIANNDGYKKIENIKNEMNPDITMDEVFKYLSVSNAESTLYQMKNRFIELAIIEIGNLKKSKNMNGVRLCKSSDHNARSETFSTGLHIVIPGYNFPFTVHANNSHLMDYANKYHVNFEDGNIHNPNLSACVYKYTDKQMEQISKLKKANMPSSKINDCIKFASEQFESLQEGVR